MKRDLLIREFNRKLDHIIQEDLPILKKVKAFVIKSGGKRIRPLIHYFFTQLLDYRGDEWRDVGAIGELVHAASLVHDDVIDEATMRRGQPSVNALHGNKNAVLAGDYLLACGLDHLGTLTHSRELLPVFTRVIRMLSVAELLQEENETKLDLSQKVYERIIVGKTGVLFAAMTETAAILAGVQGKRREQYREFGEKLGLVFQIRDDYLDYYDDGSDGKDLYQDFKRGLVTRPLILLRDKMSRKERKELERVWAGEALRANPAAMETMLAYGDRHGIRRALAVEIETEVHGLMRFVREHPQSEVREAVLEQLTRLLVPVEG